jgi:hypothetical protein
MLGHLEEAPALAFPSGMAAIAAVFLACSRWATGCFCLPTATTRPGSSPNASCRAWASSHDTRPTAAFLDGGFEGYRLVFAETPSNPGLDLCDLTLAVQSARKAGALLVVDNTTMTPYGQRPLDLGADIVRGRRHQGAERAFRCAVRACCLPRSNSDGGNGRLAQAFGFDSRTLRGLARSSRTRDAGGALRTHVRQCDDVLPRRCADIRH